MKSLIATLSIAAFGLSLAAAPLSASAAGIGIGINVGGPGYNVHAGYVNPAWRREPAPPPPRYGWRRAPAQAAFYEGYYGVAPGGYYGYYHRGSWYTHRRWGNGVWVYF